MEKKLHILILEDLPSDAELAQKELKGVLKNYTVKVVDTEKEFVQALKTFKPDLIISDYQLPSFDGLSALKITQEKSPFTPFIILTGSINEDTAVECIKAGADDYVIKEHIKRLGPAVLKAMENKKIELERKQDTMKLIESEEKYRNLVDSTKDGIVTTDSRWKISFANTSYAKMLGYNSPKELIGKQAIELYAYPEQREEVFKELTKKGFIKDLELDLSKKNGSIIHTSSSVTIKKDKNGKIIQTEGIVRDITERKQAEERLKKTMDTTIQTMSKIIEVKDPYTSGHQLRVSQLATALAKELNLPPDKIEGIRITSLLHDIGKISVPTEILSKTTRLTDIEFSLIKEHSQAGYDILKAIDFSYPVAQIVLQHHEKINGTGYPNKLKGDEIFLEARIMGVADVVEAMSSHRPYRPALGINKALEEISQNRGTLYDPEVVEACLKLFKEKGFKFE